MHWHPPTLAKIETVKRSEQEVVQGVIREVIESHPEDYVLAGDWVDGALGAIKKMIRPSAGMLLVELLTADGSHENIEELQKEAKGIDSGYNESGKSGDEARGEDPATVLRPDAVSTKEAKNGKPINEDAVRLGF